VAKKSSGADNRGLGEGLAYGLLASVFGLVEPGGRVWRGVQVRDVNQAGGVVRGRNLSDQTGSTSQVSAVIAATIELLTSR
jgi:hypothetical protein